PGVSGMPQPDRKASRKAYSGLVPMSANTTPSAARAIAGRPERAGLLMEAEVYTGAGPAMAAIIGGIATRRRPRIPHERPELRPGPDRRRPERAGPIAAQGGHQPARSGRVLARPGLAGRAAGDERVALPARLRLLRREPGRVDRSADPGAGHDRLSDAVDRLRDQRADRPLLARRDPRAERLAGHRADRRRRGADRAARRLTPRARPAPAPIAPG